MNGVDANVELLALQNLPLVLPGAFLKFHQYTNKTLVPCAAVDRRLIYAGKQLGDDKTAPDCACWQYLDIANDTRKIYFIDDVMLQSSIKWNSVMMLDRQNTIRGNVF
ncbi:conserved hypothetical protein [Ricinus communis]|uniref:Uncharacterized protein n=1 Tax=Ricinus communis TaxID=3988 RepID=B9REG3_RICCO|nr:conserved hypothetical protein [Ricinus communis]